jgi:hypothetical protein
MSSRLVFNFPLDDEYYVFSHRSTSMAAQYSSSSTDSNRAHSSAAYQSQASSHENSRQQPSAQETSQYPSHNLSYGETSNSQYRGTSASPSDKSDKDSNKQQYCPHPDCLDANGRPTRYFSRKADVARHHISTHEKQFIDCPRPRCNRKGENGFTRMDHLKEHQRGYHGEPIPERQNSHDVSSRHAY